MKRVLCFLLMCFVWAQFSIFAGDLKKWNLEDINIRDPFIWVDSVSQTYFMYRTSSSVLPSGKRIGGVEVFTSKNLKDWKGPEKVLTVPDDNWITGDIWAPEVHQYNGKYYLFATLNSDIPWKKGTSGWPDFIFRGTQIFYSESPMGPFVAFDKNPHTPMDQMALDGTLYVEDGIPYMVYCHEWVQLADGAMNVVRLTDDLSGTIGNPLRLFHASSALWSTGRNLGDALPISYVTDGCFLYRTKTGKLLMIWSSFHQNKYAIGIAESTTGKVVGPWTHQSQLLFGENGGHGMLFKSLDGKLFLILHGPNEPSGSERACLFEIEDMGYTLKVKNR